MHMFPLGRVLYMPLSTPSNAAPATPTTTLLGPVPTDFPSTSAFPVFNTILSNPFNFCTPTKFEHATLTSTLAPVSHVHKRNRDELHDTTPTNWSKKRSKLSSGQSSHNSSNSHHGNGENSSTNTSTSATTKNALMLLHELKPSIEYKLVSQTGPSHRPVFTMRVEVNGQIFEGMAQTKKEAKQAAAEKALRSFTDLPFPLADELSQISDSTKSNEELSKEQSSNSTIGNSVDSSYSRSNPSPNDNEPREIQSGLSPLYLLNQLKRDARFEELVDDEKSTNNCNGVDQEFRFVVFVDEQKFFGFGRNKKLAKTRAAQSALEKLFGMCFDKEGSVPAASDTLPSDLPFSRRDLADRISICVQEKFDELTKSDSRFQRRKVLAGIVQTKNFDLDSMKTICVTTGTKCISGDRLTLSGATLNDCHAEIIARRCLIRYFYGQIEEFLKNESNENIFQRIDGTEKFRLKSSINFHLYISTSPCGDGRLFAPQESLTESTTEISSKQIGFSLRKSRGLLRTKIEAGEGTIPVSARTIYQSLQTWDGILGGERLLTMSCSDKLCRWNFLGVQGGLLSTLIEPIYLTSIIIGSLYHSEHIRRALFGRIENTIGNIPSPYGLRRPFISGVSNPEMRTTSRAPNHAFIWNSIDQKSEIVDTSTGLTSSKETSSICKAALFRHWSKLMKEIQSDFVATTYCDAKNRSENYQNAKIEVHRAFQRAGLGIWITKPHEQDEFDLSFDASNEAEKNQREIPSVDAQ